MTVHWPSFLIGMAVPLVASVALAIAGRIWTGRRSRESTWAGTHRDATSPGSEHLRFTPRLMGELRKPSEHEDHARAS